MYDSKLLKILDVISVIIVLAGFVLVIYLNI